MGLHPVSQGDWSNTGPNNLGRSPTWQSYLIPASIFAAIWAGSQYWDSDGWAQALKQSFKKHTIGIEHHDNIGPVVEEFSGEKNAVDDFTQRKTPRAKKIMTTYQSNRPQQPPGSDKHPRLD